MADKGMGRLFLTMFVLMAVALAIGGLWTKVPLISNTAHLVLDPTAGALINWNLNFGTLAVFFIIALLTTLIQKYATDQKTLRELKAEQKELQKDIQKYKHDPGKMLELQKNMMPTTFKIMSISMKSSFFTIIPFILLLRWFMDFFTALGSPKFFGFLTWFWFYLISIIVFSSIIRKVLKVA